MGNVGKRLLVIDDEPDICDFIAEAAEGLGFEVRATVSPYEFKDAAEKFQPAVIVLDLQMPDADGIELLRFLGDVKSEAQVLVVSGMDSKVLATAQDLGVSRGLDMLGSLQKPIMLAEIEAILKRALSKSRPISEEDLKNAISNGEITVYYQPIASRSTAGNWIIDGAEALARWNHPQYGMVKPGRFIPLAEQSGLVIPLTDFIFRAAVEQVRAWNKKGLTLDLSLNLSAELIDDLEFPDRLSNLFREHDVDVSRITLELTETAAMSDPETTMDILTRLRIKGINLAVDDFGTGYSSIRQLYRMPFNELKIDISFVLDLGHSDEAKAIVDTMIYLAHKLGMTCCAEGVENREILHYLERAGCDKVQGHYLGKAQPAGDLESVVGEWKPAATPAPRGKTPA